MLMTTPRRRRRESSQVFDGKGRKFVLLRRRGGASTSTGGTARRRSAPSARRRHASPPSPGGLEEQDEEQDEDEVGPGEEPEDAVAGAVLEFGHVLEVHAVDAGEELQGQEDGSHDGQSEDGAVSFIHEVLFDFGVDGRDVIENGLQVFVHVDDVVLDVAEVEVDLAENAVVRKHVADDAVQGPELAREAFHIRLNFREHRQVAGVLGLSEFLALGLEGSTVGADERKGGIDDGVDDGIRQELRVRLPQPRVRLGQRPSQPRQPQRHNRVLVDTSAVFLLGERRSLAKGVLVMRVVVVLVLLGGEGDDPGARVRDEDRDVGGREGRQRLLLRRRHEFEGGNDEEEVRLVALDLAALLRRQSVLQGDGVQAEVDGDDLERGGSARVEPPHRFPSFRLDLEVVARRQRTHDFFGLDAVLVVLDDVQHGVVGRDELQHERSHRRQELLQIQVVRRVRIQAPTNVRQALRRQPVAAQRFIQSIVRDLPVAVRVEAREDCRNALFCE
mmetsp:Transcript_22890/g.70348  ORF Transcript_22890/g.70348 Transcript_22890/m.70348 type:complete len:502 (-) Transcript_22890:181-1686(-)